MLSYGTFMYELHFSNRLLKVFIELRFNFRKSSGKFNPKNTLIVYDRLYRSRGEESRLMIKKNVKCTERTMKLVLVR